MMEMIQLLLLLLAFSSVYATPSEQYYVNDALPNQGFYYNYQLHPRSTYFFPNNINKPDFHPELGMSPQYHDLVYNYVKDFAGTQPPPHADTFQPFVHSVGHLTPQGSAGEAFGIASGGTANLEDNNKETAPVGVIDEFTDKPKLNDYFLPSDFLSLPNNPNTQFYGRLDAIKTKRISPKAHPTSLPPLGGVISNYILTRDQKTPQNLIQLFGTVKDAEDNLQHIKRQTADNSDGVVILAEPPQNSKMTDETKEEPEGNKEEEQMEAHPGIAQSKPSAIALAGPGGMAQASPVGTALVGQGGLAVAAPSGTAVAGPAGGSIPIQIGGEKQRKETTEKSSESDAY